MSREAPNGAAEVAEVGQAVGGRLAEEGVRPRRPLDPFAPESLAQRNSEQPRMPKDVVLLMVSAFEVTPDMAVWSLRSSVPPTSPSLGALGPGEPFGKLGMTTHSWVVYGQRWVIQGFLWIGDSAPPGDVATMDLVLQSITYDEAP